MATSENTVLISFNVQLRSKQIVPWTILPVDRVNTIVLFVCQNSRIELDGQATGKLYHLRLRVECTIFCNI
jgi:hypothetical protein